MRKNTPFLLLFTLLCFCQVLAQTPYDLSTYQAEQKINFTAFSSVSTNKRIYFRVNNYTKNNFSNQNDYIWRYKKKEDSDETYTYIKNIKNPTIDFPSTGEYSVSLKIGNGAWKNKNGIFTVSETGLKIKHVNNIQWPNHDINNVDSPFSYRKKSNGSFDFHRAIDITGPENWNVRAVADGEINLVLNPTDGSAKWVFIKHIMDTPMWFHGQVISYYYSVYGHLNSIDNNNVLNKNIGDAISKNDIIGKLGTTGSTGYPHTHFEIRVGTRYSQLYLNAYPSVNDTESNEFVKPISGSPAIDARVNPLLFLNDVKNNNTLRYSIETTKTNDFMITVKSDYLEDDFNQIYIGYKGESKLLLNFNTREGLPVKPDEFGDTHYDIDYTYINGNKFIIYPERFKGRVNLTTKAEKDYKISFWLKNPGNKIANNIYVRVRDIYGNIGVKESALNIKNQIFLSEKKVYPNPVKHSLFITDKLYENFLIYNYLGKKIMSGQINNNQISVSNLKNGIYLLYLLKADRTYLSTKIVKSQ